MVVRFFMLQSHYRSPNDLTDEALQAAEKGFKRLMEAHKALFSLSSSKQEAAKLDERILQLIEAAFSDMDDDFNTPKALAKVFELVTIINSLKDAQLDINEVSSSALEVLKSFMNTIIFDIFGLKDDVSSDNGPVNNLMDLIIDLRQQARSSKDWTTSDKIRDALNDANIIIKDGKEGTSWSYK
jgi:cysteinyl-tRNA synthetase